MIACACLLLLLLAVYLQTGTKESSITRDELMRLRRDADKARREIGPPYD
jgi:hypothetical protein